MPQRKILVVGATGQQGGSVVQALLRSEADFTIYGLTRDKNAESAKRLAANKVIMVQGDMKEPNGIFRQMGSGVWGVFSMTQRGKNEESEGKPLIDAALANGVQHFIYTSADRGGPIKSDSDPTVVPHFITKYNIEKYLIERTSRHPNKMRWTILRPVTFMENFGPDFVGKLMTRIMQQMGDVRLQLISTKDIGETAALIFENPSPYSNKALTLAGESLNYHEMNAIFKDELGFDAPIAPGLLVSFIESVVSKDIGKMAQWFNDGGYAGRLEENKIGFDSNHYPELMGFRTWLKTTSRWVPQIAT